MSCLFDSMLVLLKRHGAPIQNSLALRHYVVDALLRNPQYRLPAPAPKQPTFTCDKCDKCDSEDHGTAACPWFKKPREKSTEDAGVTIQRWCQMVSGDMNTTPQAYATRMRHPSTWGGGLELALMSKLFGIRIHVYRGNRIVSRFECAERTSFIVFELNWSGSHYTPRSVRQMLP